MAVAAAEECRDPDGRTLVEQCFASLKAARIDHQGGMRTWSQKHQPFDPVPSSMLMLAAVMRREEGGCSSLAVPQPVEKGRSRIVAAEDLHRHQRSHIVRADSKTGTRAV
jgi:hypothetical protein